MTTNTPKQARCKQGTLHIAGDHILLRSRHRVPPTARWIVSRESVTELIPQAGHGVTMGLIIRCGDGTERRLDWLLPHDAQRIAVALGYEWSIQLMREMTAVAELGTDTLPLPLLTRMTAPEKPRVVVAPAVPAGAGPASDEPRAHSVLPGERRLTGASLVGAITSRSQAAIAHARRRWADARPAVVALIAWAGAQLGELRSIHVSRPSAARMKLLYLALLATLLAVSSTGWLFPGKADSQSVTPETRLVQVYGGLPPVIVTTPTPTPTAAPTEPPFATPTLPTPLPQPTATPPPPPPPASLDVTFTCAWATDFVGGQICVHTQPYAALQDSITYCTGQIVSGAANERSGEWASVPTRGWVQADGNGNYTWTFVPKTRCVGPATVTVTASWQGQSVTRSVTFIVKP